MNQKKKAIFLDRDGTLIEEVNFLSTVEETHLFPYTIEALRLLSTAGYIFVVVTNQSGVAREFFGEADVDAVHNKIQEELSNAGLEIASFHFCPHMPDAGCACRKPAAGMIEQALRIHDIDLKESWTIGDKELDVELGFNAGTHTALVLTGYGRDHRERLVRLPEIVAENLLEVARKITGTYDPRL